MDADDVSKWVQTHKIPAAAIGGIGLAGVVAVIGAVRNRKGGSGSTSPNTGTYFVVPGAGGLDGFNTIPGPDSPYIPKLPDDPSTGTTPAPAAPAQPVYQAPPTMFAPVPATMNPLSTYSPPVPTGVPLALPQLDPSSIYSMLTVANPVGYTDAEKARNQGSYNPSLSDYATERPGGIERTLVAVGGGPAGASYTIDNTGLGSGPVVPVAQRIAGERYDQYGRVIA